MRTDTMMGLGVSPNYSHNKAMAKSIALPNDWSERKGRDRDKASPPSHVLNRIIAYIQISIRDIKRLYLTGVVYFYERKKRKVRLWH